jgi:hypothetical protein
MFQSLFQPVLQVVLSGEVVRDIPASPLFFGLFTFGLLALLLYFTMRIDRD